MARLGDNTEISAVAAIEKQIKDRIEEKAVELGEQLTNKFREDLREIIHETVIKAGARLMTVCQIRQIGTSETEIRIVVNTANK